jgi:hypothetical protein
MHRPLNPENADRYRGGLPIALVPQWQRERFEKPYSVRSSRTKRTNSWPVKHRVRLPHCRCGETGSSPVQVANISVSLSLAKARASDARERRFKSCHADHCRRQLGRAAGPYKPGAADNRRRQGSNPWAPTNSLTMEVVMRRYRTTICTKAGSTISIGILKSGPDIFS